MTAEIKEMSAHLMHYNREITKGKSTNYYAPDIPDKIADCLIDEFDSYIVKSSIVAYIDTTLVGKGKSGVVFTEDGFYHKHTLGKPVYIHYASIDGCTVSPKKEKQITITFNTDTRPYVMTDEKLNLGVFYNALMEMIHIDSVYGQVIQRRSGKVTKDGLSPDIEAKCHAIIHSASVACGGVGTGLAQIPAADSAVITPIQITMIISLGAVFSLDITEAVAKSIITSAGAAMAGRTLSQFLVGWIPGAGNIINTATAASLTEMIGWMAVNEFKGQSAKYEGMKIGYEQASVEYAHKLIEQAEAFIKQTKDFKKEREEYEELISALFTHIQELEANNASQSNIVEIKHVYNELKALESA